MNFGSILKGFGGMSGSPMSQLDNAGKLRALGAAFGGDQDMLSQILGSLGGQQGGQKAAPVLNDEGEDISAGFGGEGGVDGPAAGGSGGMSQFGGLLGSAGGRVGGEIMGGMGLIPLLGRSLGFGKKGR